MGEILALRWLDVDFERRLVCVEQNDWRGHLAMRGAAPLTLKELAAHKNLATTMRYTHVTEDAKRRAIRLLEPPTDAEVGNILETGISRSKN